ncbi:MAG: hypothetical protein RLZZ537_1746 [Pseudomonadota bacterium]
MTSTEADIQATLKQLGELRASIAKAIVGQDAVVEQLLIGLLAGGHCLLEGVPGRWCAHSGRRWPCRSGASSSPQI